MIFKPDGNSAGKRFAAFFFGGAGSSNPHFCFPSAYRNTISKGCIVYYDGTDTAGDGTTTATVLAQAIFREGVKTVAAGASPTALKRGIEKAVEAMRRGAYDFIAKPFNPGHIEVVVRKALERAEQDEKDRRPHADLGIARQEADATAEISVPPKAVMISSGPLRKPRVMAIKLESIRLIKKVKPSSTGTPVAEFLVFSIA